MDFSPGIYFGLDEAEYHAVPALSNSGIKWLRVSPLDFWARSWMNPDREEENGTVFMEHGKAYHKRLVEGRDAFYAAYAADVDPAAYPSALKTAEDLKERLKELGQKVGGAKPQLIERLMDADPRAQIWDVIAETHRSEHPGKIFLSQDLIARIEIAAAMIEKHPQLSKAFTGGAAEVSILWEDEATGVPMKARLDRLKARAIVDLKTFSNPLGKPIDIAVFSAMASGRYHIQAAVYDKAAKHGARHIKEGRVFGEVDKDVVKQLAHDGDREFLFVFQQTGAAPVARGYTMPRNLTFQVGEVVMREAVEAYRQCLALYGSDPWLDPTDIKPFDDADFPQYMTLNC